MTLGFAIPLLWITCGTFAALVGYAKSTAYRADVAVGLWIAGPVGLIYAVMMRDERVERYGNAQRYAETVERVTPRHARPTHH